MKLDAAKTIDNTLLEQWRLCLSVRIEDILLFAETIHCLRFTVHRFS